MPPSPSTLSCLGIVDDDEFINVDEADEGVTYRVLLQALVVGVALWESTFIQSDSSSSMALGGITLLTHPGRTSHPPSSSLHLRCLAEAHSHPGSTSSSPSSFHLRSLAESL